MTRSLRTIVGRMVGSLLERILAVARHVGDKPPAPQELLEPDALRGVVFDDEHAVGVGGGRP